MSPQLQSSSFQTVESDFFPPGPNPLLNGQVTDLKVLDPTELDAAGNPEVTSLLEVDDEFDVQVTWELTGANTTVTGGYWVLSLYSDDMDGVGAMNGLIAGPAIIPLVLQTPPAVYQYTFQVPPAHATDGPVQAGRNHQPLADRRPERAHGDVRVR